MQATQHEGNDRPEPDLIEVGWLLLPSAADVSMPEAEAARRDVCDELSRLFPQYRWMMPQSRSVLASYDDRTPIIDLIELAESERDRNDWDFALAVTDADLESYLKSYALGAPSRAYGVAVLSTWRLRNRREAAEPIEDAQSLLQQRVGALALHLFGDLNGLDHTEDVSDYMFRPNAIEDFDQMHTYSSSSFQELEQHLAEVADPRLEEATRFRSDAAFYLNAVWQHRGAIAEAVGRSQPWLFPYRLSKLTTAAVSTMTILLITAEAWDLGMTQQPATVIVLSILTLVMTSAFVASRQRVLVRRQRRGLTEQRATATVVIMLSILLGMATTYVLLFAVTLLLSKTLFSMPVVVEWAAALQGTISFHHYLLLAGFVATLGLVIGALGASFEQHDYFRHVALVDEET